MIDNPVFRRIVTVGAVIIGFAALTVLAPLALAIGALIDLGRYLASRRSWITQRCIAFLWVYLLGEIWAVAALAATSPLSQSRKQRVTLALQSRWVSWNLAALTALFRLTIDVEGDDQISPGPVLVLVRHASMVDTLLPGVLVANRHGIDLRYVLKKELLVDPALDIAGNRLPNYFVDRGARADTEVAGVRALACNLTADDGVLIYPEGTRFSERKLDRAIQRMATRDDDLSAMIRSYRMVLPPRTAGTLALLEESGADVLILGHHGLEGLATVGDIWSGGLVGSTIRVKFWRIPRRSIPSEPDERKKWLFSIWRQVDEWLVSVAASPPMP